MTAPRLFLEIPGKEDPTLYLVEPIDCDANVAVQGWRLIKADKEFYDISIDKRGWMTCSCMSFLASKVARCKHLRMALHRGLLKRVK